MDIPLIGNTASRTLAQQFHSSLDKFEAAVCGGYDFTQLPDFGATLHQNIYDWFGQEENWYLWRELRSYVRIAPPAPTQARPVRDNPFVGKNIVITKLDKARSLGVTVLMPAQFFQMAGE